MVERTLAEVTADTRVRDSQSANTQSDQLICDIRINKETKTIQYQTEESNQWMILGGLVDFIHNNPKALVKDATFTDDTEKTIIHLQTQLQNIWDEKSQMFRLERRVDEDGEITELVLPLETLLTNEITIAKLYDKKGKFIAEDIEDQLLEQNIEMVEIWNIDSYIKPNNWKKVYQKKGEISYRQFMKNRFEQDEWSHLSDTLIGTLFVGILTVAYIIFMYHIFKIDIMSGIIIGTISLLTGIPVMMILQSFGDIQFMFQNTAQYVENKPVESELLFEVQN